jgi:hypothetical protein
MDQSGSGSGHAKARAQATLQLAIRELQYVLQCIVIDKIIAHKQLILVFFLHFCSISVALAQNTTRVTTATTMAAASRNAPLAPHMRPCAPHRHFEWMGNNPLSMRMYFGGRIEGVYGPQSAPLFWRWCIATTSECFEGHTHPQQPKKLYPLAWGVVAHPFDALAWSARPHVGH